MENSTTFKRFESLDILRGLCMFGLTIVPYIFEMFAGTGDFPWLEGIRDQFGHTSWVGLTYLDVLMPLFVFCTGASIPFAFKKYRSQNWSKGKIYGRIIRRVLVLWILGMMVQGKLLTFDPSQFRYYSNTLQAIAAGYLVASVMYLNTKPKTQIFTIIGLMLTYTVTMLYIHVGDFGGIEKSGMTLANYIDKVLINRSASHTWSYTSISFAATAMIGTLSGEILLSSRTDRQKALWLILGGLAMILAGQIWQFWFPCIKKIWSTSFVLLMAGLDYLLYGLIYWCVDYKGWNKGWTWLKIFGVNALLAYLLNIFVNFNSIASPFLEGLSRFVPENWMGFVMTLGGRLIFIGILYLFYKKKIYFKV